MIRIVRTTSSDWDFVSLVKALDADLAIRDGEEHAFYNQFNSIEQIKHAIVAYHDEKPAGCGAIKAYSPHIMEVKRMYTSPEMRGKGIGIMVLNELEAWASELGCKKCILETGKKQPEAIALYKKNGYSIIPNYGPYAAVGNSSCFEKKLN